MALQLTRPFLRPSPPPRPRRRCSRAHCLAPSASARSPSFRRPYTSVLVVPTGVGDALPVARALAAVADCGGDGTIAFAQTARKNRPLIITVQENETVLDDTPNKFDIDANYWEAIGVVAVHKAGINPNALRRQGIDHLKGPLRLYPMSCGSRKSACSPAQEKVYTHELV